MVVLLLRTLIVYTLLLLFMRLMGKRQIGQLEVTDLVTTFMLSEIATLPIENPDIPLINAVIPIIVLSTFEVVSSMLLIMNPRLKNIFSSRPGYLIKNGKLMHSEMVKNRISTDELISELRQNGITDISQADYAIMEQDGRITVLPKASFRPLTANDLGIEISDDGLSHIIISNGVINDHGLSVINRDARWLSSYLKKKKVSLRDIFLMTANDSGEIFLSTKENIRKARRK